MPTAVPKLSIQIASSSSSASEEEYDGMNEALMPLRPSPKSSLLKSSPATPRSSQRRGSVVQLAGSGGDTPRRSAALSLKGELHAALKRLCEAESSGDVRLYQNLMLSWRQTVRRGTQTLIRH